MPTMTAAQIIRAEYGKARNFVTDHPIRTGKLGRHAAYELAWGRAILSDGTLYGVSIVLERDGETRRSTNMGDVFASLSEAERHIEHSRTWLRDPQAFDEEWTKAL